MASTRQSVAAEARNVASAHLTNTMRLMEKTCVELEAEITSELADNPALQLVEARLCPECRQPVQSLPCPACEARRRASETDGPIVYLSPRSSPPDYYRNDPDDQPWTERLRQPETLPEHILRQLILDLSETERQIAAYVLARLDERGFLADHVAEISSYLHVRPSAVERVLWLVQRAEPVGVASRNVRECLLIQIETLEEDNSAHPLGRILLSDYWEQLGRRDYGAIARRLGAPVDEVRAAARFIRRSLTPFPARAYWGHDGDPDGRFHDPDARIMRNPYNPAGALMVELYTPTRGMLQVDPRMRAALRQVQDDGEREEWQTYIERASLFAKCIRQRNNAMRRVLSIIVERQRSFILGGNADLIPMTRAELAKTVQVHESTVSRAVANKTVSLPSGRIVPLARFFDRSLPVREAVRTIVGMETSPMTDEQISYALHDYGYEVARRTVAKYRSMLGILPANVRGRQLAGAAA